MPVSIKKIESEARTGAGVQRIEMIISVLLGGVGSMPEHVYLFFIDLLVGPSDAYECLGPCLVPQVKNSTIL